MAENLNKPGVFRGSARLATVDNLESLRAFVISLLKGNNADLSEDGYIPWKFKEDGTVDFEALFPGVLDKSASSQQLKILSPSVPGYSIADSALFGELEAKTFISVINHTEEQDFFEFELLNKVSTTDFLAFFKVSVVDINGIEIATFTTPAVDGNAELELRDGDAKLFAKVSNFKEINGRNEFNLSFMFDLKSALSASRYFKVKVCQHANGIVHAFETGYFLYNFGVAPTISSVTTSFEDEGTAQSYKYCSGLKYAKNGAVSIRLGRVENLNKDAADLLPITKRLNAITSLEFEDFDYSSKDKVASIKVKANLSEDVVESKCLSGTIAATNAFAKSDDYIVRIPVLAYDDVCFKSSTDLDEFFSDESRRVLTNFERDPAQVGEYEVLAKWNSEQSLVNYDSGKGLMVVPGRGLSYPSGDWSNGLPAGSPDYSVPGFHSGEKFFCRVFEGDQKTKFSGKFIFTGITKQQFTDERLSVVVSADRGETWMNLKAVRNTDTVVMRENGAAVAAVGIMTVIYEKDGAVVVEWAYPRAFSSNQPLYFKLGMRPSYPCTIKSISLRFSKKDC